MKYSDSVETNRNTILKYPVPVKRKRIWIINIPIPIRFLITPIRLIPTSEVRLPQSSIGSEVG